MLPPKEALQQMALVYGVSGAAMATIGLLNLISGVMVARFRGRTVAIVALSCGLLTILNCFCLPTSAALFIYGLIVLLNDPVRLAFKYGERGHTSSEIQQAFARLPLGQ